ncbi:MAG: ankyrin repeat domain-containing protein [Rickettsiaceae bacterium]|nr:MAG: ankyrin repeat domain-containing protein [Rickettsiaceae bacterium]
MTNKLRKIILNDIIEKEINNMRINALYNAVREGNKQEVIELLESGASNSNPYDVIMMAVSKSLYEITEELLKSSNFNIKDIKIPEGMPTLLYKAANNDDIRMVNLLLRFNAEPQSVLCFPDDFIQNVTTSRAIIDILSEVGVQNYIGMTVRETLILNVISSLIQYRIISESIICIASGFSFYI